MNAYYDYEEEPDGFIESEESSLGSSSLEDIQVRRAGELIEEAKLGLNNLNLKECTLDEEEELEQC